MYNISCVNGRPDHPTSHHLTSVPGVISKKLCMRSKNTFGTKSKRPVTASLQRSSCGFIRIRCCAFSSVFSTRDSTVDTSNNRQRFLLLLQLFFVDNFRAIDHTANLSAEINFLDHSFLIFFYFLMICLMTPLIIGKC